MPGRTRNINVRGFAWCEHRPVSVYGHEQVTIVLHREGGSEVRLFMDIYDARNLTRSLLASIREFRDRAIEIADKCVEE